MGVIDDFPRSHDYVIRDLDPSIREDFARFDAAFDAGQELPGEEGDLRVFGRWAQLRLSRGTSGGHDYDERVLRATRFAAEGDIPWTFGGCPLPLVGRQRADGLAAHQLPGAVPDPARRGPAAGLHRTVAASCRGRRVGSVSTTGRSGTLCTSSWRTC